ncbi:MAG: hypothetical protein JO303_06355 [Caulobacteraceae bacterium]|nr:hypothetical protein [Caulobacteraceae bacterium]
MTVLADCRMAVVRIITVRSTPVRAAASITLVAPFWLTASNSAGVAVALVGADVGGAIDHALWALHGRRQASRIGDVAVHDLDAELPQRRHRCWP